jgi:hypothetical protein
LAITGNTVPSNVPTANEPTNVRRVIIVRDLSVWDGYSGYPAENNDIFIPRDHG